MKIHVLAAVAATFVASKDAGTSDLPCLPGPRAAGNHPDEWRSANPPLAEGKRQGGWGAEIYANRET